MSETVIGALSVLVALGAALTGYAAHRHQVRRGRVQDSRESTTEARQLRADERAVEAERREALTQASMVTVDVRTSASALHGDFITTQLRIGNGSSQPIRDLVVHYRGRPLDDVSGGVSPGGSRSFLLPVVGRDVDDWEVLAGIDVAFADAAGNRWRREHGGGLRQGRQAAEGGAWQWGELQSPIIYRYGPTAPFSGPRAYRRSRSRVALVGLLTAAVLVAGLVLWLR